MGDLTGRVVILTGAGTGIGRAAATRFASEGANLILVGRRREPLQKVCDLINDTGGQARVHTADLENGESVTGVADRALEEFGRIDVLINNAGHSSSVRSIRWVKPDEWESVFRINIDAVYRLTQACLPSMIERGEGTVITVSSLAALQPGILGGAPYSAAKAASYNLMRGINAELRGHGIRATAIIPGEVNTPILDGRPVPPSETARESMMQPEDVADAILFCAKLPHRTLVEEMVLLPTFPRDMTDELEAARTAGSAE